MLKKCKKVCADCKGCALDRSIPCSPDCENLTLDGKIKLGHCVAEKCDVLESVFDTTDYSALIEQYGEMTNYPCL